jgi:hypothetical protein
MRKKRPLRAGAILTMVPARSRREHPIETQTCVHEVQNSAHQPSCKILRSSSLTSCGFARPPVSRIT